MADLTDNPNGTWPESESTTNSSPCAPAVVSVLTGDASNPGSPLASISVVVPVYYNAGSLPELLRRLRIVAEELRPLDFEFVFVDDGSADDSFAVLAEQARTDPRVRAVRLSRNFGSNPAILAGLTCARGDAIVVIAADLQDPPELIPELVASWQAGHEVVLAARRGRDDPLLSKLLAGTFNRLFRRFVFRDFPPDGFDFMLVSRRVADILARMGEKNSYIFGQVMWVGFDRAVVYYDRGEREVGQSMWTFTKKVKYFIDAFTAFSYLPVRMASALGLLLALGGFGYAALVVVLRLLNLIQETGFSALMVAILVIGGTQLVVTGMIGEYLWRVLEESRRRPPFIIAASVNLDDQDLEDLAPYRPIIHAPDGDRPVRPAATTGNGEPAPRVLAAAPARREGAAEATVGQVATAPAPVAPPAASAPGPLRSAPVPTVERRAPDQGVAAAEPAVPSRPDRRPLLGALAFTSAFYMMTFAIVREYYRTHLPHYDSIGSYLVSFNIMNVAQQQGLGAAIALATTQSISWLYPFYALLWAWAPMRAPEWLISLNFVCLFAAQAAIITCLRELGYSPLKQFVLSLLPVVPAVFYVWDGGFQDLRRDPQMNLLLIGCLFLSLAYVRAPTTAKAVGLGLIVAMTQWSRDNAVSMIAIIVLPAIVLLFWESGRDRDWLRPLRLGVLPLAVFALVTGPYYWLTYRTTLLRYTQVVWGIGEDRRASLREFWRAPIDVLLGGSPKYNGGPALGNASAELLWAIGAAVVVLLALRVIRLQPDRLRRAPSLILISSGAFITAAVVVYNTLGLGYGAQFHGMPFVPVAVGLVALMAGLADAFCRGTSIGWRQRALPVAALVGAFALIPANANRMLVSRYYPAGAEAVAATRDAAFQISDLAAGRPVALLWIDGFSRHHANYYLTQQGRPFLTQFESVAVANRQRIDLEQPLRPTDDPAALRTLLDQTVRRYADVVFVCQDTAKYGDRGHILWPFQVGQPVIEGILADPSFIPVARFQLPGCPFVLLENRAPNRS